MPRRSRASANGSLLSSWKWRFARSSRCGRLAFGETTSFRKAKRCPVLVHVRRRLAAPRAASSTEGGGHDCVRGDRAGVTVATPGDTFGTGTRGRPGAQRTVQEARCGLAMVNGGRAKLIEDARHVWAICGLMAAVDTGQGPALAGQAQVGDLGNERQDSTCRQTPRPLPRAGNF